VSSRKLKRGRTLRVGVPEWEPLRNLAPDHFDDFKWMHEVELEDGTRLQAYEHFHTGRYLHLDRSGRAFVFAAEEDLRVEGISKYEEVSPRWLLDFALARSEERATLLRQNVTHELQKLSWTRSATKHRISRKRIRHVIEHCEVAFDKPPPSDRPRAVDTRLVFLGDDPDGVAVEVIAVEPGNELLVVIHAMEMRPRYKTRYEEARRWQK
jgi:hypothetical protein